MSPSPCITDTDTIHLDDVTTPGVLAADVIFSPAADNLAMDDGTGVYVPGKPVVVSSIPGSPSEGDQIIYQVAGYTSLYWHMVYTSGHWRYVGGSPIVSRDESQGNILNLDGAGAWKTIGGTPNISLPFTGAIWEVNFGAECAWDGGGSPTHSGPAAFTLGLSIDGGAPGTTLCWGEVAQGQDNFGHTAWSHVVYGPVQISSADTSLAVQYRCYGDGGTGSNATFQRRFISARPVYL
jgi:hypothetical protein